MEINGSTLTAVKHKNRIPSALRERKSTVRKKTEKHTNTWRLKNLLLNNQQITKGIKEKIKKYLETNENKTQ